MSVAARSLRAVLGRVVPALQLLPVGDLEAVYLFLGHMVQCSARLILARPNLEEGLAIQLGLLARLLRSFLLLYFFLNFLARSCRPAAARLRPRSAFRLRLGFPLRGTLGLSLGLGSCALSGWFPAGLSPPLLALAFALGLVR